MKKILGFVLLSFLFCNISISEEVDCKSLNECLSKNYTIKNKETYQPHKQLLTMIYELEKKREKKLIHCSVTYKLIGLQAIPTETRCFKP